MNFLFLDTIGYESDLRVSGHHLARVLVQRGHRVVMLFSPVTPLHRLARKNRAMIARRFAAHAARWVRGDDGVESYVPWSLLPVRAGWLGGSLAMRLAAHFYTGDVLRRLRAAGFVPDVISLHNMMFWPLAQRLLQGALGPAPVLGVRIEDKMDSFGNVPPSMLAAAREACAAARVVSVTAHALGDGLEPAVRAKLLYLPNAADQAHFAAPQPRPAAYARISKPIVVYVGSLYGRFDWDLLQQVVRRAPELHFFLISPNAPQRDISDWANLSYIAGVPYAQTPAYYQHAAVSIIPFRRNELVDAVNPLKLHESLAAGTPVVATDWDELRRMQAPVALASGAEDFTQALRNAANAGPPAAAQAFLARHTWESNVEALLARIAR